jgi:hypothetical protein
MGNFEGDCYTNFQKELFSKRKMKNLWQTQNTRRGNMKWEKKDFK